MQPVLQVCPRPGSLTKDQLIALNLTQYLQQVQIKPAPTLAANRDMHGLLMKQAAGASLSINARRRLEQMEVCGLDRLALRKSVQAQH